ncbi:SusC/RagA family TonB-linked outer membrane protein [uncultured Aquimarina sp.]|uniref:SusC/RagA family TonB-linked outer membrane protein n=1 Tax=uncultured Aquimarina sp. TaxID=575652 RepID=UPI00262DB2A0|nr:SusC/RagA family TonB-linked outer membrane protein [uncultured Aquimarina sp.]
MKKQTQTSKGLLLFLFFFPVMLFAQETITGKVVIESTGEGAPFVNIVENGTNNGTASDIDGNFSITVGSLPARLRVFALGFSTKMVDVSQAGNITIQISESTESLEEVVVTGLGSSIKRANLANAVSTVSSEELVGNTGQTTVDGALYGKVTGVNITASSGAPGGGTALRLRGISSINGNNQPLFIVDGVYINNVEIPSGLRFASGANRGNEENAGNRLADIDPNDIENIEILKGASAAAIYGTRANAGVVIITTKKGKGGKTKIRFSQDTGINVIQNRLGLRPWTATSVFDAFFTPNPDDPEAEARSRAAAEAEVAAFNNAIQNGGLIDYEDEIYGNVGFISETKLSASGGNDKTRFYIGGSYRDEEGIIQRTGFDRFSIRSNIDHKISEIFDVSLSSNYVRSNSSRSFTGNENEGGLSFGYTLAFTRPWNNLFPDADGNYPNNPNYPGNPIFVRDQAKNEDSNNRFIQGVKFTSKLLTKENDRVKFVVNGGVDYLANETYVYVPETHQAQVGNQEGFVAEGRNNFTQFNLLAFAVWDHTAFGGDLNLTTQGGVSYLEQQANLVNSRGSNLFGGQTSVDQSVNQVIDQTRSNQKDFGYFAQVEGNYKDQIIGTLGYRLDKSTLNGDVNKFYGFPKASLAINVANFDFWQFEPINQLKVRTAYGETGSSAAFGSAFTSLNPANIGGNGGLSVGTRGDRDIEPETSAEFEVGLDLGILDSRISFEASYYNRKVSDLILSRNVPASSGFTTETTNLADLVNQGLELAVRGDVYRSDNFFWNTGVQFYFNRSEVTRLDVPAFAQPGAGFGTGLGTFFIEEGQPVTQIVGNIDPDGDGPLEASLKQVGNVEPDFQMAFNNQFTLFKQLDVSFLLQWKQGGDNLNLSRFLTDLGQTSPDLETPEGQARLGTAANAERFIEDAGYVRLREASIYYRFPSNIVEGLFGEVVEGVKLGVSGRNLFTITDYSSYDPEVSVNGGAGLSSGIEVTPFPSSQQFYFHLNVNF